MSTKKQFAGIGAPADIDIPRHRLVCDAIPDMLSVLFVVTLTLMGAVKQCMPCANSCLKLVGKAVVMVPIAMLR